MTTQSIHKAAKTGNVGLAKQLIDKGANVNARNIYGRTPLALAVEFGHKELAELLRKHGGTQ